MKEHWSDRRSEDVLSQNIDDISTRTSFISISTHSFSEWFTFFLQDRISNLEVTEWTAVSQLYER